jgi:hypothetical protein
VSAGWRGVALAAREPIGVTAVRVWRVGEAEIIFSGAIRDDKKGILHE